MDNSKIKTTNTCGVLNCINIDHITATYHPSQKDIQHMQDHLRTNGVKSQAHQLQVPEQLLQNYLDTHIDII